MAAGRTLTAFGFDCGLDWRPTVFVDGMSSNRVCDACGLVPSTAAMLSCRHVLCPPCYDRTIASDGRCCLDGVAIECDDVVWSTFTTESLLRRKIHCWNAPAGCSTSGPAQEILDHFSRECKYHAVTCWRCESSVTHRDIVGHISSGSCTKPGTDERTTPQHDDPKVNQITSVLGRLEQKIVLLQVSFEENLKRMANDMQKAAQRAHPDSHLIESNQCLENTVRESTQLNREALAEIGKVHAKLQDKLGSTNTSLQGIIELVTDLRASESRTIKETESAAVAACAEVKRDVDALRVASSAGRQKNEEKLALLEKIMDEIKANAASGELLKRFYKEACAKLAVLEAASNSPFMKKINGAEPLEWNIESVSELKKEISDKTSFARSPEYFYGYRILPGVRLKTKENVQSLHLAFQICRGVYDQILTWPIQKKVYLRFLHPIQSGTTERIMLNTAVDNFEEYGMPTGEKNSEINSKQNVELRKLEVHGYIKDDKLSVRSCTMSRLLRVQAGGQVQRSLADAVPAEDIGATLEQEAHHRHVVALHRHMEGEVSRGGTLVHAAPGLDQELRHSQVIYFDSDVITGLLAPPDMILTSGSIGGPLMPLSMAHAIGVSPLLSAARKRHPRFQ
ncbi:hypothetical protein HPB48_016426 [Haemaphysalis longicornis]|uniref:TRAF1-6 MATH domain-containing protein n=1 Tax=Haemaphysalis longicornis TaxID=44386 RepID=A0A9J6GJ42_HAELO|nr:hypothetical protein HPB48_016426 [Haemaphysalis longicornis]